MQEVSPNLQRGSGGSWLRSCSVVSGSQHRGKAAEDKMYSVINPTLCEESPDWPFQ